MHSIPEVSVSRFALAAVLVLAPSLAGAQGFACANYVAMPEEQRVLVAHGLLSGYLLAASIARERSLDAVSDPKLGPGWRAAASELGQPLTRLQGKTARVVAEDLRVECGKTQAMARDVAVAFAALLRDPRAKPKQP